MSARPRLRAGHGPAVRFAGVRAGTSAALEAARLALAGPVLGLTPEQLLSERARLRAEAEAAIDPQASLPLGATTA
jgi:hypothetical protein